MATITSSMRIADQMTPVLKLVVSSLNQTVSAMGDVEKSMDKSFDKRSIDAARKSVQQVELALKDMPAPIEQAKRSQERFNKTIKDGRQDAGALLSTLTGFVGAYIGIRSAVGLLSNGFDVFKEYESSMSRVKALSGATAEEFERLSKTAKMLGETTSFSAAQAADGMGFLAMAGFKTNDIVAAMPGLLSAAAAGQTELGQTADIVSNILSGFGLQANETARVADVLTQAFTSSNTDLAMLGETMKYVAPNARAAGLSLEETAAAAGILGNSGIQASMAGTSLRAAISRMSAPIGQAKDLMKALSINVVNTDGTLKGLAEIIDEVTTATDGMGDAQKMAAVKMLVGEEAASGFLTLMSAGSDTLREFTSELENSAGRADEIAGIMLDNTRGKLLLFQSKVEGAWIDFYERLGSGSGEVSQAFDNVLNGMYAALEWVLPIFESIIVAAGNVVNFFTENWSWISPIIWGVGSALLALIVITQGVSIAQALLNAVMRANPYILVATLIIAIVVALIRLWQTNDEFAAGFLRAWNSILNFFGQIPIFFTWVGNGIVNAFNQAKVIVLKIVDAMANGVIDTINKLINAINSLPGVHIGEALNHISLGAKAAIEAEAVRQAGEANLASMQAGAAEKAAEREANVQKFLDDRATSRAANGAEKGIADALSASGLSNLGDLGNSGEIPAAGTGVTKDLDDYLKKGKLKKVDKVGKIDSKVDISSEDLKQMRELAEMKNIQNFVSLTPTVTVKTGDINNGYDVETIVSRITDTLETQIASSAKGVYG